MKKIKLKKNISKIINILLVSIIIVLALHISTSKSDKLFELIGYRNYIVLSGSMQPKFYPGDVVVTKHHSKTDIQVNDIIKFKEDDETIVTHRIIEKTEQGYITQ